MTTIIALYILLGIALLSIVSPTDASPGLGAESEGLGPELVDPDTLQMWCVVAQNHGLKCDFHEVATADGYILGIHKVYNPAASSQPRPPVVIAHTFMDSSFSWILNLRHQALPYILADEGYDVYLYNARGNRYSQKHEKYAFNSQHYWDFGWDEMAAFDVVTALNTAISGSPGHKRAAWIGHGQGATVLTAALIRQPSLAKKLSVFVSLASTVRMKGARVQSLRILEEMGPEKYLQVTGLKQFAPTPARLKGLFKVVCRIKPWQCENIQEALVGPQRTQFNESRLQVYVKHSPGGTSVRNLQKTVQGIHTGNFQQFDYGYTGNKVAYQAKAPPLYDFKTFPADLPVAVYHGSEDRMSGADDHEWLIKQLGDNVVHHQTVEDYAHMDFAWDYSASNRLYPTLIKQIKQYTTGMFTGTHSSGAGQSSGASGSASDSTGSSAPAQPARAENAGAETDDTRAPVKDQPVKDKGTLLEREASSKKARTAQHPWAYSLLIVVLVATTTYSAYLIGKCVRDYRQRNNQTRMYELIGTASL